MSRKSAKGSGTIRQRKDGTWEARYTIGRDPGTGKQLQRSIYGKTQSEVRQKLTAVSRDIDNGNYLAPAKLTVAQWLEQWLSDYTSNLKPYSLLNYRSQVKNHIVPYIGAIKVQALTTAAIQRMYNRLQTECALSPKTIRNVHSILHSALEALVDNKTLQINPASACQKHLPKVVKKEMSYLSDETLASFLQHIKGHAMENLFLVDLFTGLRQGEILGLRWSSIDFKKGCITIDKQLYMPTKGGDYTLEPLKNRKTRTIYPAPFVFDILRQEQRKQKENRLRAGNLWNEGTLPGLVFTNELGGHLSHKTVYKQFKKEAERAGISDIRFHDMRHSYAVSSLRSGDDIKVVQENLGHATAAFTLDVYGHASDQMKRESAERMELYIQTLQTQKAAVSDR